jgi:DNA-directed RNA polymerase subunit RPC12/RpoP
LEGRVYLCSWKRLGRHFHVWVKSRPKLAAEGRTFAEADEALWSLIVEKTGDGENSREYQPRAPVDAELEEFLNPPLVAVIGDALVHVEAGTEFDGVRCTTCGHIDGRRSDEPLVVADLSSGFDAGAVVIHQRPYATATRYIFSDEFLALLLADERKRFAWRRVVRPSRAKRVFHELLDADLTVHNVGVSGLPKTGGWRCDKCGFRRFPHYVAWTWPSYWVCATDLPRRVPSCFGLNDGHDLALCITADRWSAVVGKRGTRGVLSYEVGVAPPERCEKAPKLRSIRSIARDMAKGVVATPVQFK